MLVFVLIVLGAGFAFMASLATAIFLKALPWKRLLICYLAAALLVGLVFAVPAFGEGNWFEILDVWIFVAKWIFIACWIGTAPVALVLMVMGGAKPATDPDQG